MSDTRSERLCDALDDFLRTSPGVVAASVVSHDGLAMASALPDEIDEDRLAAMSAALLSLGEQASVELGRGDLRQLFVEGEHGYTFCMSARNRAVLVAITDASAKIGLMLFELRRAAEAVGDALEPDERVPAFTPAGAVEAAVSELESRETATVFSRPDEAPVDQAPLDPAPSAEDEAFSWNEPDTEAVSQNGHHDHHQSGW